MLAGWDLSGRCQSEPAVPSGRTRLGGTAESGQKLPMAAHPHCRRSVMDLPYSIAAFSLRAPIFTAFSIIPVPISDKAPKTPLLMRYTLDVSESVRCQTFPIVSQNGRPRRPYQGVR